MTERLSLFVNEALIRLRTLDFKREEGQGVTEYGIVLAFVAVALAAVLIVLKSQIIELHHEGRQGPRRPARERLGGQAKERAERGDRMIKPDLRRRSDRISAHTGGDPVRFFKRLRGEGGQGVVEFAMVLPLFALLIYVFVTFGKGIYVYFQLTHAANAGSPYRCCELAAARHPVPSPGIALRNKLQTDYSLPGGANVAICYPDSGKRVVGEPVQVDVYANVTFIPFVSMQIKGAATMRIEQDTTSNTQSRPDDESIHSVPHVVQDVMTRFDFRRLTRDETGSMLVAAGAAILIFATLVAAVLEADDGFSFVATYRREPMRPRWRPARPSTPASTSEQASRTRRPLTPSSRTRRSRTEA